MKLTEARARAIPTPKTGYTLTREESGLAVRVTANNARSWVAVAWSRRQGRTVVLTVGPCDSVPIAKARSKARELASEIALGHDPLGDMQAKIKAEKAARQAERDLQEHTLRLMLDDYVSALQKRNAPSATDSCLPDPLAAAAGFSRPACADVTARDIRAMLERVSKQLAATASQRGSQTCCARRCVRRLSGRISRAVSAWPANPVAAVEVENGKSRARSRVLTMDELRQAWQDMQTVPGDSATVAAAKSALRVSLLTGGQRLEQLLRVTSADVDLEQRTIVLRDSKGGASSQETPKIHDCRCRTPWRRSLRRSSPPPTAGGCSTSPRTGCKRCSDGAAPTAATGNEKISDER